MPSFCRHGRFIQNCTICREPGSAGPNARTAPRAPRRSAGAKRSGGTRAATTRSLRVRRDERAADDGYRGELVPGVRSSADAQRLADELGFATGRLAQLAADPPGLYAEIAAHPDREQAAWLGFLLTYLCPLEAEDCFAGIRAATTSWAGGELPDLATTPTGPRTSHGSGAGTATLTAYRAWAQRAGSQDAAFAGEPGWTPERRFQRVYERLALPGLARTARFDLLVVLGWLGLFELRAGTLGLAAAPDSDAVLIAAKRVFGIGDPLLLERRAATLAEQAGIPLGALDLALWNWARPAVAGRATLGAVIAAIDPAAGERAAEALGL